MCIAAKINAPISFEYLISMQANNPDGAGVAWVVDGKLRFKRGLTAEQIFSMQEGGELTLPYLLHFRWATHGTKIPQLTHPFPIGARAFHGELEGEAESVLIHNGTWPDYKEWLDVAAKADPEILIDSVSDTCIAAFLMQDLPELADELPWASAVASVGEDGLIFVKLHGLSWTTYGPNDYSNLQWLPGKEWWNQASRWRDSSYSSYAPYSVNGWVKDEHAGVKVRKKAINAQSMSGWQWDPDMPANEADDHWRDYVRARYGDEAADCGIVDELEPDLGDVDSLWDNEIDGIMLELEEHLEAVDPQDVVSEDPSVVNAYLARLSA